MHFPPRRSRPAGYPPNRQPTTVGAESGAGETRRRVGRRRGRLTSSDRQSLRALVMQTSAPALGAKSTWDSSLGAIQDSISQCSFLQMTYTAENPHADGNTSPGARPRYRPPRHRDLHATSRTHDNRMAGRQTSCRQQTAPPQPRCSKDVTAHPHRPGLCPQLLYLSVFISSNEFKVSCCFTMGRDGSYKIFPAPVVISNYTLLLRFTTGTLNVRHCFCWEDVCRF